MPDPTPATPPAPILIPPPPPEFLERTAALGIEFEPGDLDRLARFLQLLLEANRVTNLTAITDPTQAWTKHILDALTLVPVLASALATKQQSDEDAPPPGDESESPASHSPTPPLGHSATPPSDHSATSPLSVIDIGSGGGVPAIPLAIVVPDARFTLVEATGKKVEFLERTIRSLGLSNARVLQARAEQLGQDHREHREKYDLAMARALGHLAVVIELCGPLVKQHGVVVAIKGAKVAQELPESEKALGLVGLRHVETIETPTGRLVVMEKTIKTPRLYPRRDGEPARVPLGVPRK